MFFESAELAESSREQQAELVEFGGRFEQLTPREREVFEAVVSGMSNRACAEQLSVSEKTVETHRLRVMHKMGVKSLAELVRIALRLQEHHGGRVCLESLLGPLAKSENGSLRPDPGAC